MKCSSALLAALLCREKRLKDRANGSYEPATPVTNTSRTTTTKR